MWKNEDVVLLFVRLSLNRVCGCQMNCFFFSKPIFFFKKKTFMFSKFSGVVSYSLINRSYDHVR